MSTTITDILSKRAKEQPEKRVFTFLENGEYESDSLTYAKLHDQSRQMAIRLLQITRPGERALILLPQSLDYIIALFGCFYAGVVAVPAYPPKRSRKDLRIEAIFTDCAPGVIVANRNVWDQCQRKNRELLETPWLLTDDDNPKQISNRAFREDSEVEGLALLQYTSGSTGNPKGVMVTHKNMISNAAMCELGYSYTSETKKISWMPFFHDFGLFGEVIQALYSDFLCVIMTPQAFAQKPVRWLRAIAKYKGTHTNAPSFGYDMCIEKVSSEECAGLDLSSWKLACCAAEPIRPTTLLGFSKKFGPNRFNPKAFCPAYGMAEATLVITVANMLEGHKTVDFNDVSMWHQSDLSAYSLKGKEVVSCGTTHGFHSLKIVDPQTHTTLPDNCEGEVWFKSQSVSAGYWQKEAETSQTFDQELEGVKGYLRTGDLGFLRNKELYITGRIKDLIIVRGQNFYPDDLEHFTVRSHEALSQGSTIALSVEHDNREKLVIVQEIRRTFQQMTNFPEVFEAIRVAISEQFGIEADHLVLVTTKSIPKTSSGKVMRAKARQQYLNGELSKIAEWKSNTVTHKHERDQSKIEQHSTHSLELLFSRLLSEKTGIPLESIDRNTSIKEIGLESIKTVELSVDLEAYLEVTLDPSFIREFNTVKEIAQFLFSQITHSPGQ